VSPSAAVSAALPALLYIFSDADGGAAGSFAPALLGGPASFALNAMGSMNTTLQPAHS